MLKKTFNVSSSPALPDLLDALRPANVDRGNFVDLLIQKHGPTARKPIHRLPIANRDALQATISAAECHGVGKSDLLHHALLSEAAEWIQNARKSNG